MIHTAILTQYFYLMYWCNFHSCRCPAHSQGNLSNAVRKNFVSSLNNSGDKEYAFEVKQLFFIFILFEENKCWYTIKNKSNLSC